MREPAPPILARSARRAAAPAPASGGGLCKKESKMTQSASIDPTPGLTTPEVEIGRIRVKEDYGGPVLLEIAMTEVDNRLPG
jgi:hypothetical protein